MFPMLCYSDGYTAASLGRLGPATNRVWEVKTPRDSPTFSDD